MSENTETIFSKIIRMVRQLDLNTSKGVLHRNLQTCMDQVPDLHSHISLEVAVTVSAPLQRLA